MNMKKSKEGRSKSSWFLKGDIRQVVMMPATPGAGLAQVVKKEVGTMVGPDKGLTKVVEKGGRSIMLGLQQSDPFPREGCDFGESRCIIGPGCSSTGVCYKISCLQCTLDDQEDQGASSGEGGRIPRRYQYLGQTGTSAHRRMLGHLAKGDSVVAKHQEEYHQGGQGVQEMEMKVVSTHKLLLERLVSEGNQIAAVEQGQPGTLMNGRGEYQRSKQVRFETRARRI